MEMGNDDAVQAGRQGGAGFVAADETEVWKSPFVVEAHVHAAV
jgi:hypothetical protein